MIRKFSCVLMQHNFEYYKGEVRALTIETIVALPTVSVPLQ